MMTPRIDGSWLLILRGIWHYHRRVPKAYFTGREYVTLSTGVRVADDPHGIVAKQRVMHMNNAVERYWRDRAAGRDVGWTAELANMEATIHQSANRRLPRGLDVARFNVLGGAEGTASGAKWRLSDLLTAYETNNATLYLKKSPNQKRRHQQVRDLALREFIAAVGTDCPVTALTRSYVLTARNHYVERVKEGTLDINTANKYLGYVATMFRSLNDIEQLGLDDAFSLATIPGGQKQKRPAFKASFVQERIFAEGARVLEAQTTPILHHRHPQRRAAHSPSSAPPSTTAATC